MKLTLMIALILKLLIFPQTILSSEQTQRADTGNDSYLGIYECCEITNNDNNNNPNGYKLNLKDMCPAIIKSTFQTIV